MTESRCPPTTRVRRRWEATRPLDKAQQSQPDLPALVARVRALRLHLLLDPFGCAAGQALFGKLVLRVAAPFHGMAHHAGNSPRHRGAEQGPGRPHRSTLARTDQHRSLRQARDVPISRASQIQFILQPILETRPKAVFLDYTFNADSLPTDQLQAPCGDDADNAGCKPAATPKSGPTPVDAGSTGAARARALSGLARPRTPASAARSKRRWRRRRIRACSSAASRHSKTPSTGTGAATNVRRRD